MYDMIDVNSPQYKQDMQRLQSLRTMIVLWLVVLALGVILIPLMLIAGWVRDDRARLESELLSIQTAISDASLPSTEVTALGVEVSHIEQLITVMQTATVPSSINWPVVVDAIDEYEQVAITLSSLTQTGNQLTITGRAEGNDAVVRYQQSLLDSGAFADVVIISMVAVAPEAAEGEQPEAGEADAEEPAAVPSPEAPLGNVEFVIDVVVGTAMP
jgi:Tfp pilus assembly protein PilN